MKSLATTALALAIVVLILWLGTVTVDSAEEEVDGEQQLSGPYSHANLSIYLVHGPCTVDGDAFITLSEAMERKLVTVHETGNVGELAIENHSVEHSVFIQSGDIVKGGRQDRTLAYDVVVPPKSGRLPIKSFCVESGRWRQRGGESAAEFSGNSRMLASKELKLAAKERGDQSQVWARVAQTQDKLSQRLGKDVRSTESGSSLQLALEDQDLKATMTEYTEVLASIVEGQDDVIGFAFAINGEVNSIDIYAANGIFTRLWPKLLAAAVVEAIGEQGAVDEPIVVAKEDVVALMEQADAATEQKTQAVSSRIDMNTRGDEETVVFETVDQERGGKVLHKNYVKRSRQETSAPQAEPQLQQTRTIEQTTRPPR